MKSKRVLGGFDFLVCKGTAAVSELDREALRGLPQMLAGRRCEAGVRLYVFSNGLTRTRIAIEDGKVASIGREPMQFPDL